MLQRGGKIRDEAVAGEGQSHGRRGETVVTIDAPRMIRGLEKPRVARLEERKLLGVGLRRADQDRDPAAAWTSSLRVLRPIWRRISKISCDRLGTA